MQRQATRYLHDDSPSNTRALRPHRAGIEQPICYVAPNLYNITTSKLPESFWELRRGGMDFARQMSRLTPELLWYLTNNLKSNLFVYENTHARRVSFLGKAHL